MNITLTAYDGLIMFGPFLFAAALLGIGMAWSDYNGHGR